MNKIVVDNLDYSRFFLLNIFYYAIILFMGKVKLMKNRGYTIPEIIVVAAVLGLFSIITISKVSYAFVDTNEISETTKEMILEKSATAYGTKNLETIKNEKSVYISASDLVEAGFLADDEDYKNVKIKVKYKEDTDSISVEIIK